MVSVLSKSLRKEILYNYAIKNPAHNQLLQYVSERIIRERDRVHASKIAITS